MAYPSLFPDPLKVIFIGDVFVSPETMKNSSTRWKLPVRETRCLFWGSTSKEEFQQRAQRIEKNGPDAESYVPGLEEELQDADIVITHFCPLPYQLIMGSQRLKLIGTCRGGVEHIAIDAATLRRIPVIHVIRNAEPVADFTLGLILAESRNIARSHCAIKNGNWQKEYANSSFTTTLRELTVGLLGLGNIGRLVAKKLNALGVKVIGYDPYVREKELQESGAAVEMVGLERVFKEADVVSLHLRLSEENKHLVDANMLGKMKRTSYLINTSRSGLIDEDALIKVLKERQIGGAALDVFSREPLSLSSTFLELDNVTLTSHIAGDTVDAIPKSPNLLAEEIHNFVFNAKTDMIVNREVFGGGSQ